MSNGGGQLVVLPLGSAFPNFKMYHYTTGGGTVLKDIYSDEDLQTTMAQPAVADSNGVIAFYALGDFRIKVDDEDDVNIYDWDNYHITQGQPLITDHATALPAAAAANKGHLYSVIDSSNVLRNVAVNQNTSFVSIYAANASGVKTDTSIILKSYPWYDITHTDWGAVDGEAVDQTARIQAAIDAIEAADGGVLFIPEGEFQVDGSLDINNVKIAIVGQGVGKSILKQTADAAAPLIDYDTTDITETFEISGMSLRTTFAGAGDCINCNWPTSTTDMSNCYIHDIEIGPTAAASASAYFDKGIVLSDASGYKIQNVTITGKTNDTVGMTEGIGLDDACTLGNISNCKIKYATHGIDIGGTTDYLSIVDNIILYVTRGINASNGAAEDHHIIARNEIEAWQYGARLVSIIDSKVLSNTIRKHASSTTDFIGITLAVTCLNVQVSDNSVRGAGTSGTDVGISIAAIDCSISNNQVEDQDTGISAIAASETNFFTGNRAENNTAAYSDASTAKTNRWESNYLEATQSIASATTITIPPVGSTFLITGTTTINRITESWPGRKITLYKEYDGAAADNTTITDSVDNLTQSIRLSGATTLDQEHTLSLLCSDDGMWYATGAEDN